MNGLGRLLLVLFALAPPRVTRAQVVPMVDVGVASLGYAGTVRATALSVTPALRVEHDRALVTGSATFSQFNDGEWSMQGALAASVFTRRWRTVSAELAATGNAIAYRDAFRTGEGLLRARVHAHTPAAGIWLGGGSGAARHADAWHPLGLLDAGAWTEQGQFRLSASITSRMVAVADSFITDGGVLARFRRRGTHADAVATIGWTQGPFQLELVGGARDGGRLVGDARWMHGSATLRLTEWLQIIAEAGGEPEIVAQRLPEGRFGLLAVRLSPRSTARVASRATAPVSADFILGGTDGGLRTIRVREPHADRVELRADFTDWQPVPLVRARDGTWQIALPLAPGVYRVTIRADGGEWRPPSGIPAVADEFGTLVGLLVVR